MHLYAGDPFYFSEGIILYPLPPLTYFCSINDKAMKAYLLLYKVHGL